jgi:hypothetical protein
VTTRNGWVGSSDAEGTAWTKSEPSTASNNMDMFSHFGTDMVMFPHKHKETSHGIEA